MGEFGSQEWTLSINHILHHPFLPSSCTFPIPRPSLAADTANCRMFALTFTLFKMCVCVCVYISQCFITISICWNGFHALAVDLHSSFNILRMECLKTFICADEIFCHGVCRHTHTHIHTPAASKTKRIFDYFHNNRLMQNIFVLFPGYDERFNYFILHFSRFHTFCQVNAQVVAVAMEYKRLFISLNCRNMLKWDCRHEK